MAKKKIFQNSCFCPHLNVLNARKQKINHRNQGKERTYRQSQIRLRQDELSLTEICQNHSVKEKSKTTLLKPQQQLLAGTQLEPQTCC